MATDGAMRPVTDARGPLVEAPRAHDLLEQRQSIGRTVPAP